MRACQPEFAPRSLQEPDELHPQHTEQGGVELTSFLPVASNTTGDIQTFRIGRMRVFLQEQAKISTIRLQTLQMMLKSCRKCPKMPGQLMKNCSTSRAITNW